MTRAVVPVLIAGVAAGVAGFVLFGIAHALLIEPIWERMLGGLPFAVLGGVALAVLVQELCGARPRYLHAMSAGGLAWAVVIPSTAFGAWLRISGMRGRLADVEVALELAIAFAAGAFAGALIARRARSALVAGIVAVTLVTVMAGPIPVTNSSRAVRLFLSFLPMFVAGTLVVAAVRRGAPIQRRATLDRNGAPQ